MGKKTAWRWAAGAAFLVLTATAQAQQSASPPAASATSGEHAAAPVPPHRLPPDMTTRHELDLPGRRLTFAATAGSVTLTDGDGAPLASIGYIAYRLDGADPRTRPVTFAMNGGPGFASAVVHLGLLGPWRLPLDDDAAAPSAPPVLAPNPDTWLDFTDLVFLDPVGTGYSRLLNTQGDLRKKFWSVDGDIDSLAQAMRLWLEGSHRMLSPKFIAGESYAGFRGPRLVRALESSQGVGISGLVMISPLFDFGGHSDALEPLFWVNQLPTLVAAQRALHGPVTRASMADVEDYASSQFLIDVVHGEGDPAALERRIARVTELTGLDAALVRRRHGLISNREYLRERNHDAARISSAYDATVTKPESYPAAVQYYPPDALLAAISAPVTSAILDLYETTLHWTPDGPYEAENGAAGRQWDYGAGSSRPESLSYLRGALALDPHLHVLIGHGLFDFVTPYFATKLMLDQIPATGGADRVRFVVYPGGHMFYTNADSRAAFREEARKLYGVE